MAQDDAQAAVKAQQAAQEQSDKDAAAQREAEAKDAAKQEKADDKAAVKQEKQAAKARADRDPADETYDERLAYGSGGLVSPGEEETAEQGAVRTGRALPEHDPLEDSAGLTPAATAARVDQTHAQRDETTRENVAQGLAADGDGQGGVREHPRT